MLGYFSSFDDDLFDQFDRVRRQMDQLFGAGGESSGIRSAAGGYVSRYQRWRVVGLRERLCICCGHRSKKPRRFTAAKSADRVG